MSEQRYWWTITVSGYGPYQFFGTELEASEASWAKAQWEGGRASKRRATAEEATKGRAHIQWQKDKGYPLNQAEIEALS